MVALSVMIFATVGTLFLLANLVAGHFFRRRVPTPEKLAAYECGEVPVGSSWVQFDLRFYIVALVYLVFAVEVVLLYPWAVVYGSANESAAGWGISVFELRRLAFGELVVFLVIVTVGLAYLWKFGYLDWVRSVVKQSGGRVQ